MLQRVRVANTMPRDTMHLLPLPDLQAWVKSCHCKIRFEVRKPGYVCAFFPTGWFLLRKGSLENTEQKKFVIRVSSKWQDFLWLGSVAISKNFVLYNK